MSDNNTTNESDGLRQMHERWEQAGLEARRELHEVAIAAMSRAPVPEFTHARVISIIGQCKWLKAEEVADLTDRAAAALGKFHRVEDPYWAATNSVVKDLEQVRKAEALPPN